MTTAASETAWKHALDPEDDALILESRVRKHLRLGSRDRWASVLIAGSFALAAGALAFGLETARTPSLWAYVLFIALYGAAARVEFEVGAGAALPTQLVLVPMLFVLPLAHVPLCVAAALVLRDPVKLYRGPARTDRVLLAVVSSWHAVGPVLVLGLALAPADRDPDWRHWPLYVTALAAQFAFDFGGNALRNWAGLSISPRAMARYLGWCYLVDIGLAPIGLFVAFAAADHALLVLLVVPLVALLKLFSRERVQRIDHASQLGQAYRGTAFLLGDVVEADDAYTGEHSRDVVNLTLAVCDELGLSPRERRDAEFVALLHDVGKIRISAAIINKPGPLDAEERKEIETHTIIGEQMLSRVGGVLGAVGTIVRSCHERWDGTGYPDRLAGEAIPLIARIVCCTDAFSAITTDRPYRKALSTEAALAELRRCSGTHFDPWVVDAVVAVVASTELDVRSLPAA